MRLIARGEYRRMDWKNGNGMTEEIIAFPPAGTLETFAWRISLAHIEADGPFSVFAGIDRSIALVAGNGITLHMPGGRASTLGPDGRPVGFPGEWAIEGRNTDGPTTDLNTMTRRGAFTHHMARRSLAAGEPVRARERLLVFFGDAARVKGTEALDLGVWDSLWLTEGEEIVLEAPDVCDIWTIALTPLAPPGAAPLA